jgi:hypothetical protein
MKQLSSCEAGIIVVFLCVLGAAPAYAQNAKIQMTIDAELGADRTIVFEQLSETHILSEAGVRAMSQPRLTSTANETMTVLEAHTRSPMAVLSQSTKWTPSNSRAPVSAVGLEHHFSARTVVPYELPENLTLCLKVSMVNPGFRPL